MTIVRDYSALVGRPVRPPREAPERPSRLRQTLPPLLIGLAAPIPMIVAVALNADPLIVFLVLFGIFYFTIAGMTLIGRQRLRHSDAFGEDAPLAEFARANSLVYTAVNPLPRYPGVLFDRARRSANVVDRLNTASGRYVEIGNLDFSDYRGHEDSWGFVAIHLDRSLPHFVLVADRASRRLPFDVVESQRLGLEGDFDAYFTLFAPAGYERDALYVFAPDLMALFIDEVDDMHGEVIDDWFFVYSSTDFRGANADRMQRIFRIVDLVGAKMQRQTKHYGGVTERSRRSNRVGNTLRVRMPQQQPLSVYLPFVGAAIALGLAMSRLGS